jgi:hypothetical protein
MGNDLKQYVALQVTARESKLLALLRNLKYGEVRIKVVNAEPAEVLEQQRSVKL